MSTITSPNNTTYCGVVNAENALSKTPSPIKLETVLKLVSMPPHKNDDAGTEVPEQETASEMIVGVQPNA